MTQQPRGQIGGRLSDLVRDVLEESPEAARAYLRESWLSSAIRALRDARRKANLTQEDVAARLGTTQPAIARLENDQEGRTTLHRYIDYAIACGAVPFNIVLEPMAEVRQFAIDEPQAERTQACYQVWAERQSKASVLEPTSSCAQMSAAWQAGKTWHWVLGQPTTYTSTLSSQPLFTWTTTTVGKKTMPDLVIKKAVEAPKSDAENAFLPPPQPRPQPGAPILAA